MGKTDDNLQVLRNHLSELDKSNGHKDLHDALFWAIHRLDPDYKSDGTPKNKGGKKFSKDSFPYKVAVRLSKWIKHNNPDAILPEEFHGWAKYINMLDKNDNIDRVLIVQVLDWCQQNDFWKCNILSGKKFKDKFNQLTIKMRNDGQKQQRHSSESRRDANERVSERVNGLKKKDPESAF